MEYSNIHPIQDAIDTIIPNSKDKKNISNTKLFQKKKHTFPSPAGSRPTHYSLFIHYSKNQYAPQTPLHKGIF